LNNKALALLSGGLDSTLAIRVIQEQGVDVSALNFMTPFCNCTNKGKGCKSEAARVAKELDVPIRILNKGKDYLEVVRNPKFGYGKNMNPCVDCRIFMHKAAKEYMEEVGASFIITGEVLGQRPMSQRRDTINIIDRESGLKGLVLRPLSAKLFDPTLPEKEGIVDREKLLNISGRSRKEQMRLADDFKMKDYQCPAGGCLLTDSSFSRRIKDIFEHSNEINMVDIYHLKTGRHFRLDDKTKLIVSRDENEGNKLSVYTQERYALIQPHGVPGPTGLVVGDLNDTNIDLSVQITSKYFKKGLEDKQVRITHNDNTKVIKVTKSADDDLIESKII
jgi:tRNA U34 2-thiouridine synthase MnmA/TrmU